MPERPIIIATRGSTLALAQTHLVLARCRAAFPQLEFAIKVIKTTGDKLQQVSITNPNSTLPKGLFTKELEVALLAGEADLAVHSLKDLPTDLPPGLILAATPERADVRDVLIYRATGSSDHRGLNPHARLADFPTGATIATSSTRRKAQLLAVRADLNIVEIRGNVNTRLRKVAERAELDGTVLALAGLNRLSYSVNANGTLAGEAVPAGLLATILDLELMLPCVGQAAIGIEIRANEERLAKICEQLNHLPTFHCVTAERAFLRGMGGGCLSPVAAHAMIADGQITLRAVSFRDGPARRSVGKRPAPEAALLGEQLAAELR